MKTFFKVILFLFFSSFSGLASASQEIQLLKDEIQEIQKARQMHVHRAEDNKRDLPSRWKAARRANVLNEKINSKQIEMRKLEAQQKLHRATLKDLSKAEKLLREVASSKSKAVIIKKLKDVESLLGPKVFGRFSIVSSIVAGASMGKANAQAIRKNGKKMTKSDKTFLKGRMACGKTHTSKKKRFVFINPCSGKRIPQNKVFIGCVL